MWFDAVANIILMGYVNLKIVQLPSDICVFDSSRSQGLGATKEDSLAR